MLKIMGKKILEFYKFCLSKTVMKANKKDRKINMTKLFWHTSVIEVLFVYLPLSDLSALFT